jgi:hypothetical protein
MFKKEWAFDSAVFSFGTPVRVTGIDSEGDQVDFKGMVKRNLLNDIVLVDAFGLELQININDVHGAPDRVVDAEFMEMGFYISVASFDEAPLKSENATLIEDLIDPAETMEDLASGKRGGHITANGGKHIPHETREAIRQLRKARPDLKQKDIADLFGVGRSTISNILNEVTENE